jgi:hypothetical protein
VKYWVHYPQAEVQIKELHCHVPSEACVAN